MTTFTDLNLCPELITTLKDLGYKQPTPVQAQAIPLVLAGHDLIAEAQTGTGKTASFALPMIDRLSRTPVEGEYHEIRGLILTPTRELAAQVGEHTLEYGRLLGMRVISIFGGVRFDNQIRKMKRGADILVATPGRLLDMLVQKKLSLAHLEMLVFDEADRMLDLGFIGEIRQLLAYMPEQRQTLLFSATLNDSVEVLADKLLREPKRVAIAARNSASQQVKQSVYAVDNGDKADVLSFLIHGGNWRQTLVFTRTKKRADQLTAELLEEGISAVAIHGDRTQRERTAALAAFTAGEVRVLVATDVAARGLDIDALPQVVNYDLPNQPEAYVHRIGRTGRAGQQGRAISLVAPDERRFLQDISALIGKPLQLQPVPILENGKLIEGGKLPEKKRNQSGKTRKGGANTKAASKAAKRAPLQPEEPVAPDTPGKRPSLFGR
ncbi:ATP-dependent RNA helicase RhlE [Marinobacterium halophilum]|uniref:DEAD-box ATP-dependent RNA helicase RhpA n=1 Tax=Marinobacterium halophilum TaxID=267374 RepID=A0A2P8ESU0_9GAMM|nr:DEAD/DEAH box helicase [Marinobacterium halophilum]PSL12523.1 ATP-dependent RNA helicase RhlE [Marinobacterium halophilum]